MPFMLANVRSNLLYIAWTQALIATLGSLIFSEVMNFIPCDLCWYQRIFMYPIVFVLTVGILVRDRRAVTYALPLCVFGLGISVYHNLLYYGVIPQGWHVCTTGVPCETRWIQWFGFVGIPFLALTAFVVVLLSIMWYSPHEDHSVGEETASIRDMRWIKQGITVFLFIAYAGLFMTAVSNGGFPKEETGTLESTASDELNSPSAVSSTEIIVQGQQSYTRSCSACHGQAGEGVANLGPSLVTNPFVEELDDTTLLEFIRIGRTANDPSNKTGILMPGKGGNPNLSDEDILSIIFFIRSLS
ncbi:MAG: disulfide oxidoreductase [bacterium]|nr:disulfide oxidoreductase [bacterium]